MMKRYGFAALAVAMMICSVGCTGLRRGGCGPGGCGIGGGHGGHGGGGCSSCGAGGGYGEMAPDYSGANVAYPYYTTKGPRDYFLNNPPSIGR